MCGRACGVRGPCVNTIGRRSSGRLPCRPALLLESDGVPAAEHTAGLTVEVSVQGHQAWRAVREGARPDIDEYDRITMQVRYDGERQDINPEESGLRAGADRPGRDSQTDHRMQGHTVNIESLLSGDAEALEWGFWALPQAPARGARSTMRTPPAIRSGHSHDGAEVKGPLRVRMDWAFEPQRALRLC